MTVNFISKVDQKSHSPSLYFLYESVSHHSRPGFIQLPTHHFWGSIRSVLASPRRELTLGTGWPVCSWAGHLVPILHLWGSMRSDLPPPQETEHSERMMAHVQLGWTVGVFLFIDLGSENSQATPGFLPWNKSCRRRKRKH